MQSHIVDLGGSEMGTDEASETTEESGDVEINSKETFKAQLQECLDEVESEGTYSVFRCHEWYINPGLDIKDLGIVGLPLSTRDAVAIAGKCRKAPFGKGDETVVDEAVRRTWELDATEFGCSNPGWQAYLETLAQEAIQDLGVQVSAHAQPYKLLLYEEGAHFKAHRDTEKTSGMFGTLVVCLPSLHSGGSVHLSHGNKQREMDTASASAFGLQTLAWYSDVQHEIRPVEKGFRLVLTYNLVQDQSMPMQTAAALDASHDRFTTLLQTWNKDYNYLSYLVYPLEHQYSEVSLSMRNLKGQDAARGRYLDHLCKKNGYYWFLTQMTKEQEVEDDYYDTGENGEGDLTFGKIVLPCGRHVDIGLYKVDRSTILTNTEDDLFDRDPDSEDEGEYTGNANAPLTLRYHNSVIILMSKQQMLDSSRRYNRHKPEGLTAFFDLVRDDDVCEPEYRNEVLQLIAQKAFRRVTSQEEDRRPWSSGFMGYSEGERERKREGYAIVFERVAKYCREQNLSSIVRGLLWSTAHDKKWTSSRYLVRLIANQIAWETRTGKGDTWDDWFSHEVDGAPTYAYANELRKALEEISRVLPSDCATSFNQWRTARLERKVRDVRFASLDDAQSILDLIPHISREAYLESVTRVFSSNVRRQVLSRFMHLLADDTSVPRDAVKSTYQRLAETATATLKLSAADITEPEKSPALAQLGRYAGQRIEIGACEIELLNIVNLYLEFGLKNEAVQIFNTCLPTLSTVTEAWSKWKHWFVFVNDLMDLLSRHPNEELNSRRKAFITDVLHSCASYIAQSQPKAPQNWTRAAGSRYHACTCRWCAELNAFLRSPIQRVGRFSCAEKMRQHLEDKLNSEFHTNTEKWGSPYTLVVTKTNNKYERLKAQWRVQVSEMRNELNTMQRTLAPLGIDVEKAADLEAQLARSGAAEEVTNSSQHLEPSSASTQNLAAPRGVAGVKRKSDFVDLTED
ncbi:hypothetical protein M3J09_010735 [Ascochyta lentis]